MLGPDPYHIFEALRKRPDPGIALIDWEILACLAASLGEDATAERVGRAAPTVRRRINALKEMLLDGLDVPPSRELLVSWFHLHERHAAKGNGRLGESALKRAAS